MRQLTWSVHALLSKRCGVRRPDESLSHFAPDPSLPATCAMTNLPQVCLSVMKFRNYLRFAATYFSSLTIQRCCVSVAEAISTSSATSCACLQRGHPTLAFFGKNLAPWPPQLWFMPSALRVGTSFVVLLVLRSAVPKHLTLTGLRMEAVRLLVVSVSTSARALRMSQPADAMGPFAQAWLRES
jgi:hypothetical protein